MSKGVRNYTFTLNNYTTFQEEKLKNATNSFITYLCYGKEIAPTTGMKHLQGYLEMKNQKTISALKKALEINEIHLENAKGNAEQNKAYCSKDNDFVEFGTPKSQGKRTDLEEIKEEIKLGLKVDDIVIDKPNLYHQYGRTLHKIEDIILRKKFRNWMTTCSWYYGPTGIGKSHTAFENYNPETHYLWKDDNGWQDGYTGQETIIINEFRGNISYSNLLQMIDKYPYELRRRGREPVPFLAKNIIITSSLHPKDIYHNLAEKDSLQQLYRRINIYTKQNMNENWIENRNENRNENWNDDNEPIEI